MVQRGIHGAGGICTERGIFPDQDPLPLNKHVAVLRLQGAKNAPNTQPKNRHVYMVLIRKYSLFCTELASSS